MTRAESRKHMYNVFPKKNLADEKTFNSVIELFNLKVSNALAEGKSISTEVGFFSVARNIKSDKRKVVDWATSNRNKREILKNGGTPYNKESAPQGQEWLVYHTNTSIFKTIFKPNLKIAKNIAFFKLKCYKDHRKRVAKNQEILDISLK